MILRLAVIGFGNVGKEFARLLRRKRDWLIHKKGLDVEVIAIATASHGSLLSDRGLDLERVLDILDRGGSLEEYGEHYTNFGPLDIIDNCEADIMVEITPLDIVSGQPAIDHISLALQSKMHVVTANKGPIAFAYDRLESLAKSRNMKLRFEGTVMDGTPIFDLAETALQGCEVVRIEGILNSTSNYVLTEVSRGRPLEDAVKEAQRKGIAEADPSLDLEGWDAAAKITVLANVLMGAGSSPDKVERRGITGIEQQEFASARENGKKIRLIARAESSGSGIRTRVGPELIGKDSPFWSVDGTSSAVKISTDLMGDLTILETNPVITQTAYAIFIDMLLVVDWMRCNPI